MMTQAIIQNLSSEPTDAADLDGLLPAHNAGLIQLSTQMNVEQLFEAIAINCLAQIAANAAALAHCYDTETLHQMRVGLRRLHVALDLFKDRLQLPEDLQQELNWLNAQLSAARDWDVLATVTLPMLAAELPEMYQHMIKFQAVKRAVIGSARQQRKTALTALRSQRCISLLQQLTNWLGSCGWRNDLSAKRKRRLQKKAARFARNCLLQQQSHLIRRCQFLASDSARMLHRVRIAAKTMRYASEFFQSLYTKKQSRPGITALSKLQLRLGRMNDVNVANNLLLQLHQQRPQLAASMHLMRAYMRLRSTHKVKKISVLCKKYSRIKLAI